jgi:hypothetical protein
LLFSPEDNNNLVALRKAQPWRLFMRIHATILKFLARLYLMAAVLGVSSLVLAQSSDETDAAISGAMQAMDNFMLGFNARDPKAWAESLNYPHVRFASGTVTVWESAEEFAKTQAFVSLPASGWDHSHWLTRDVTLAAPGKVHIATVFQRFNSDNEVIGTYESLYIITKLNGHWGTQARSSLAP